MENKVDRTETTYSYGYSLITLNYDFDPKRCRIFDPRKSSSDLRRMKEDSAKREWGMKLLKDPTTPLLIGDPYNKFIELISKDKESDKVRVFTQPYQFQGTVVKELNVFTDNYWVVFRGNTAIISCKKTMEELKQSLNPYDDISLVEKSITSSPRCYKVESKYDTVKDFIYDTFSLF